MSTEPPLLNQLNLVVSDLTATLRFYRRLGLAVEAAADGAHAAIEFPNGFALEFDTTGFVPTWDSGWSGGTGGHAVIGLQLATREAVDDSYAAMTRAGYRGRQVPYDAFWGARYAIIEDPDGYPVGLMSPISPERKTWPPTAPPRA